MKKRLFLALVCCVWCFQLQAQALSVVIKNAARETAANHYAAAAELWERAGRLKKSDPVLLYKAAECYAQVRDYVHASDCYRATLNDKRFPLAALRFARSLKQQGRYAEAQTVFEAFLRDYVGNYRSVMTAVAENELAGCALAIQLNERLDTSILVALLTDSLNTAENEFAPIPFSDKLLYFSRAVDEAAQLMRSRQAGEKWGRSEEAKSLPPEVSARFRTGCFSPDGTRFYYTDCEGGCPAESGGSARSSACVLFCLHRTESGWSEPEKLRTYINLPGSTALFPNVAQANGIEQLFFASDRPGGFGGLDIYVCERSLANEDLDFSFPQNLGKSVNTGADEVTPFFDANLKILWFSSLGHPSLGGMDVFKAEYDGHTWTKANNAGLPINSPADDYYFALKKRGNGAFLSSNRGISHLKTNTTDDDIFEIWFDQ